MFSLLFIKNNSIPKIVVNLLNVTRTFSQKHVVCKSSPLSCALFEKPRIHYIGTQLWRSHLIKRHNHTQFWGKNTNVANNVILYKLENIRFLKLAHTTGIASIIFWIITIWYLYKDKFFSDLWTRPFKSFFQENFISLSLFTFSTLLGPCFYAFLFLLYSRIVKCVILNKGGKDVTFITLYPLKSRRAITVPVEKVYCIHPRSYPLGVYTSVKINSYKFNFLIDKSGTYVNGDLFDNTVGWRK